MADMNSIREPDINEIQGYLDARKFTYLRVLDKIRSRLREFWQYDTCGRVALYRVASRADYQFGDELKTTQSAYRKIWEKRKEGDSSYGIDDVEDIIGLRLVCVYPSDVQRVLDFLKNLRDTGFLGYYKEELQQRDTGYRAYHVNVALPDIDLTDYKCEIQVLTMLEETWSYKAHDLIYKPEEAVTEEEKQQAAIVSEILHASDQQSELLERQIRRGAEEESRRKEGAKLSIMETLAQIDLTSNKALSEIRERIMQDRENLRCGDATDILVELGQYIRDIGIDIEVCKIIMLLCTLREANDLDQFTIDQIEKLIRKIGTKGDQHKLLDAYRSAGLLYYCLGIYATAVDRTQKALKISEGFQDNLEISRLRSNVAYFIADGNIQTQKNLATQYALDAYEAQPDDPPVLDTLGYVQIVFGETYSEVRDGLTKCERAYEKDPNKTVAAPYFDLHRKKAYNRLLELSPNNPFPPV